MTFSEKIRKMEADYGKRAMEFTKNQLKIQDRNTKDQIFQAIEQGTTEWQSWEKYFKEYLGFEPLAMRRTRYNEQRSMTVPAQWPEWFDSSYMTGKGGHYSAPERKERKRDDEAIKFRELLASHGRPFGPFEKGREHNYLALPPKD